jgi:Ca-activated chloride channel family protein
MRKALIITALSAIAGCGPAAASHPAPKTPSAAAGARAGAPADGPAIASGAGGAGGADGVGAAGAATGAEPADARAAKSSTWIGAAPEGDLLAAGTRDTFLGVWVDVPDVRPEARPPMELALVVDTSGSMSGAKLDNARTAAAMLVRNLHDGDIVALDAFSDHARTIIPPTRLDARTRGDVLRRVSELSVNGSTNMFEGLSLGESQMMSAPASHPIRRVVMISDGIANVGPSSPETLGLLAERGVRFRAQVTSLGVGTDYDERTLDALAVRSSGRMYHLSSPAEMASIMKEELQMLDGTVASDAFVEVVPAPGVAITGADGLRTEWHDGALRIPLGALYAGQHREALVRVRIDDPAAFQGHARSMASVRLRFRDAEEGDLERIQEVVARTELTNDAALVARSVNSRTKAIVAIAESAKTQLAAAQRINAGDFADADEQLARAQQALAAQAAVVTAPAEKKRLEAAASTVAARRKSAAHAAAMPKPAQRDTALEINADAMHASGF